MVYGAEEMGVRGSNCDSVTIVGPGGPGGVKLPWAYKDEGQRMANARKAIKDTCFIDSSDC